MAFGVSLSLVADTRFIRLRSRTLTTAAPDRAALARQAVEAPQSGLFLIQFERTPTLAVREQLRDLGVDLLRYIPDDTFIARARQVRMGWVRAMPAVRWVGDYRPDDKVAASLRALAAAGDWMEIRLALPADLPPAERVAVQREMARLRRASHSRFGSIVQGRVSPAQLAALARSSSVLWIEPAPRIQMFDEIASKIVGGGTYETGEPGDDIFLPGDGGGGDDDDIFGAGLAGGPSLRPHTLVPAGHRTVTQELGYDGTGVTVAVADSGLHNGDVESMHPDLFGRVEAFFAYGTLIDAADEHSHGTHVTGIIAGDGAAGEVDGYNNLYGLGVAPGARLVAQRIFDGIGNYEAPPTFETLTRDALRSGAVIGSNSWGDDTQGRYDLSAAEFDALVRDGDELAAGDQPYILEFSAGNSGPGPQTIGSPAVAKNVIATGASGNDRYGFILFEEGIDAMADFSSRGPCDDGRIKPDVVAPGTWIASLKSASATDENAWMPISENYLYQGGTSQAGPHVSGAAAVFVQYWRETRGATPSPALVKAALINSATDMDDFLGGTDPVPNMDEGWGRVTLTNLIGSARRLDYVDQTVALTNGGVFERRVLVGNPMEPLKITLVYTDVPGLPAAVPALVNDLDLEVVGPDGALYRGNGFEGGESVPNLLAADRVNNVEAVHLPAPAPGEYLVRVRGSRVVEDVFRRAFAEPLQDFALVVSADLPMPGQGIVAFDRPAYSAPAEIGIRLIDDDLTGQGAVEVQVTSDTEPGGERVRLTETGRPGIFGGGLATATGTAAADGVLQVAHGDRLAVVYDDAAPVARREYEAEADLVPPVLTGVDAATRFGRLTITWTSDEPSDSVVEYGLTADLGSAVTNRARVEDHVVTLDGVQSGQTVFYRVRSRDAAGNVRMADAGGVPWSVTVAASATVLLVDQFDDLLLNDYLSVTTYTEALETVGADYEVWDVALEGRAPVFEELRNYAVVIWRVGEFFANLGAQEVKAMRDYVDAGGGLFMASMELLSRLDEGGFTNFRKNVLGVEDYDVDPGIHGLYGADNVSMTSGLALDLDFSEFPDLFIIPQDLSDTFQASTNAAPILFDAVTGRAAGVRFPKAGQEASGRVVFFSFPFDALPADGDAPNNRYDLLRRVLGFLAPAAVGEPSLEMDREAYTVPAVMALEVNDRQQGTAATVTATARTDLHPAGTEVTLVATARPGVYRGNVLLVGEGQPAEAGELRVRDGDLLEVTYTGGRPARAIQVLAVVDTEAPEIHDVVVEPDYNEAVVRWTTSEPSDGLAKYLDVAFPSNLTAYHGDFTDVHELRLTGLESDREYTVEIVCRDPAGNSRVDDNGGQRYRFRTLKPLLPPFVDNLESGREGWTVGNSSVDAETLSLLVSSEWQLDRPNNELAAAAWSGVACWGTNLRGEANDYADTSLVSPAILLAGGNRALLSFWHNYDFFPRSEDLDLIEVGGLYVTTNNGASWVALRQYGEASDGWEREEVDLSAYLGRTIRVGWAYGLLSFDTIAHPGWLVDDVSVTVTQFRPGRLILSNSLEQATASIRGPLSQIARGRLTMITNAPPGEYAIEFGDVPDYLTPATQSLTLAEGAEAVVRGEYTFPDANANGLSDLWEQRFFGGAAPGHRPEDDTDGDGVSDLAEFLSGMNPTNATSFLSLVPPRLLVTGDWELRWPSAVGHGYRVLGSTNGVSWAPRGDWIRAVSSATATTLGPGTNGPLQLFQLEARP